jgi:hypothetical protein
VKCRTYWVRKDVRIKRVRAAILKRPRCMICDGPLSVRYGTPGFSYENRTCSMDCHIKLHNWFIK